MIDTKNIWSEGFHLGKYVLPAFTCPRVIGNLWSICIEVYILRWKRSKTLLLAMWADILVHPIGANGNNFLLKPL